MKESAEDLKERIAYLERRNAELYDTLDSLRLSMLRDIEAKRGPATTPLEKKMRDMMLRYD